MRIILFIRDYNRVKRRKEFKKDKKFLFKLFGSTSALYRTF